MRHNRHTAQVGHLFTQGEDDRKGSEVTQKQLGLATLH